MEFGSTAFFLALLQIIWVNILLSGDNAVAIAMAARHLPPAQQKKAVIIGSAAAIILLIILTLAAAKLMMIPWLRTVSALLLVYIGVKLLLPEEENADGTHAHTTLFAAVRTILIADLVMSMDNVVAVAAAAMGNNTLLILGLVISIPVVIFGSTLLLKVIERFPIIVWLGAALIGSIAGELFIQDPAIHAGALEASMGVSSHRAELLVAALGAVVVIAVGKMLGSRGQRAEAS